MSSDSIPQKRCSKCQQLFPATTEYFRKASKEKSGLTSRCKACLLIGDADYRAHNPEHGKQWYEAHKDEINAQRRSEYWNDPEKARQRGRDYYQAHPDVIKAIAKRSYRNNVDRAKAYRDKKYKEMRDNPELWAAELLRLADYRRQNPERRKITIRKSYAKHTDQKREYGREYSKRFPEKSRAKTHKRIAMRKAAEGSYTAEDLMHLYDEQEGRCAYCGITLFWDVKRDIHVDHVIPLTKGGSNNPDNLALACHSCNESKADKMLDEWMKIRGW